MTTFTPSLNLQTYYSMSTLARHVSDNLLVFFFFLHLLLLNWAYSLPAPRPCFLNKVENAPFTITALHCAWWRHPCLCGLSLRQHSNQKVAALELTVVPRIAELTLASWHCHITSSFAPVTEFIYQTAPTKKKKKSQIQRFVCGWLYFWQAVPIFPFCWLLVAHIYAHLIAIAILEQVILYGCTMTKIGVKVPVQLALQQQPCC